MGSSLVALNGSEVWANAVELDVTGCGDAVRHRRLAADEFGCRATRPPAPAGKADVWLFVTHVTELPPIVWVMMAKRVRAAG